MLEYGDGEIERKGEEGCVGCHTVAWEGYLLIDMRNAQAPTVAVEANFRQATHQRGSVSVVPSPRTVYISACLRTRLIIYDA